MKVLRLFTDGASRGNPGDAGAGIVIEDEEGIPASYWKPQPPKLDRRGLLAALTAGQAVPGAHLGNGGVTLVVRTS